MRSRGVFTLFLGLAAVPVQPAAVQAQERGTVSGTVVEALSRRPLNGAQVVITGSGLGTITTTNGRFVIPDVPVGEVTVEAQIIGYRTASQTVTVRAGEAATVDFELAQTAIQLDEVVVTGAGVATERKKLGNTVATINVASMESAPVRNISELLAAREPGVSALTTGGMAGEGARIRIRGSASLSQLNQPIVYVDGIRVANGGGFIAGGTGGGGEPSRIDDINPDAIERIEILKGAAAATLYGTEASSGVIQIFTKKGSNSAPRYNVTVEQAFSKYPSDAYDPHAGFARSPEQAAQLTDHWGMPIRPYEVFELDLIPHMYETGDATTVTASVSGGSTLLTYFLSGRFATEDGPFGTTFWGPARDVDESRQANANLTIFPVENLQVRVNTAYTERFHETPQNNNNIYGTISSLLNSRPELANCDLSSRDHSSDIPGMCTGPGNAWGAAAFITTRESMQNVVTDDVQRFTGSVGVGYNVIGLNLDATFGVDILNQRGTDYRPFGHALDRYTGLNPAGSRAVGDRNGRELTADFKGTHEGRLGDTWSFTTTVGTQGFFTTAKSSGGTGNDFPGPGVNTVSALATREGTEGYTQTAQIGVFGQEQIGFRDWAFLTLGGRYDKHSAFGESAGGVFYPKVSVSIVPSDALDWSSTLVSSMRIRGAIGKSGRQPSAFAKFTTYQAQASEEGAGLRPSNLGNADLKPEVSREFEMGAEFGLFSDRIAIEGTYWDRRVTDVLVNRQFPVSGGFTATQLDNIGQLDAHGIDVAIRGNVFTSENVQVNLFAAAAFLSEEVTDMGGAPPLKAGGSYPRYRNYIREGYAPGAFFGPKLIQTAGDQLPFDQNGDCLPDSRSDALQYFAQPRSPDAVNVLVQGGDPRAACAQPDQDFLGFYLGKPTPDWTGTFGGDITVFNNVRMNALFEFKAGEYFVHDLTTAFRRSHPLIGRNVRSAAELEATLVNPASSPEDRVNAAEDWARNYKALSPLDGLNEIFPADFIRLRELSLTYSVPQGLAAKLGARSMAITLAGRNLALWTDFPGTDPEINAIGVSNTGGTDNNFLDGTNAWGVPIPRRFSLQMSVNF